jgi:DNA polymerase III sliding clamp (beta) subunit (PCNA family)
MITIERKELRDALAGLSKVVPRRRTLPVLQHIRFDPVDDKLLVSATDLEQHLSCTCTALQVVPEAKPFTLALDQLDLLAKGPDKDAITFLPGGEDLTVRYPVAQQTMERTLPTCSIDEWPAVPPAVNVNPVEPGFLAQFRRAAPFTSTDASRLILSGVLLDVQDTEHRLVATDGRRMTSLNHVRLPLVTSVVLPLRKLLTWSKFTPDVLLIGADTEHGWFRLVTPKWDFRTRLLDGTFPNWKQVVPDSKGMHRLVFTDHDTDLLARVLPTFPGHDRNTHEIALVLENGRVSVVGQGTEEKTPTRLDLPESTSTGKPFSISVDRLFLLDALAVGFRTFKTDDELSPLWSTDGEGSVHVLMPVKNFYAVQAGKEPPAPAEMPAGAGPSPVPPPSTTAVEPEAKPKKEEKPMPKDTPSPEPPAPANALDRVLVAYETAKTKVREANEALAAIAVAVKEALKEDKQRRAEIESVRAGLARLQSIKV